MRLPHALGESSPISAAGAAPVKIRHTSLPRPHQREKKGQTQEGERETEREREQIKK